ncbi:MAG: hypothetical protein HQK83_03135 [Fibrobacteria bacterium]|nr:hypothetical protein [Fibrobacteria bacterium]
MDKTIIDNKEILKNMRSFILIFVIVSCSFSSQHSFGLLHGSYQDLKNYKTTEFGMGKMFYNFKYFGIGLPLLVLDHQRVENSEQPFWSDNVIFPLSGITTSLLLGVPSQYLKNETMVKTSLIIGGAIGLIGLGPKISMYGHLPGLPLKVFIGSNGKYFFEKGFDVIWDGKLGLALFLKHVGFEGYVSHNIYNSVYNEKKELSIGVQLMILMDMDHAMSI